MKDTLVCGDCLSPTVVMYEEGESHLGLDLVRRFMKQNKDRKFFHEPFAWQWSDTTPTHVK
jgi:hypothetical protein